jgi:arsenite methyltransferase
LSKPACQPESSAPGAALVLDTDWDSIVWHADDPERMGQLLGAWRARFADPHLPRTLVTSSRDAGSQVSHPEALVSSTPEDDANTYSVASGEMMADYAVNRGSLTRDQADAWTQDLRQLGRDGRYFFSLNRYLFLARR